MTDNETSSANTKLVPAADGGPIIRRKRKADALSRMMAARRTTGNCDGGSDGPPQSGTTAETSSANTGGRGSVTGWTYCPLCVDVSKKKFALGRGIAEHLHAVHTPWMPMSKMERKKRKRRAERAKNQEQHRASASGGDPTVIEQQQQERQPPWDPTPQEVDAWEAKIVEIVTELERSKARDEQNTDAATQHNASVIVLGPGYDRNGQQTCSYRDSLPGFLQSAAKGDLDQIRNMVQEALLSDTSNTDSKKHAVVKLLNTRDRHLSTAMHWAAGGGHLNCLKYLLQLQDQHSGRPSGEDENTTTVNANRKITMRRRDGKTCLHYAARFGHLNCVEYLLQLQHSSDNGSIDEVSGDGTTPLHLACYGGHVPVVEFLLAQGASALASNEWGCGSAHWVAMTKNGDDGEIKALCQLLQSHGVSFVQAQKQGHTALHKACQRKNRHVIEWMAQALSREEKALACRPDHGGHTPWDIWTSAEGDAEFAKQIQENFICQELSSRRDL